MTTIQTHRAAQENNAERAAHSNGLIATAAIGGAFLASACCVVPLLLVTLGVTGAWIGRLTVLEPYKPFVAAVTLALIGFGFWRVYFRPQPVCEPGSYCARPSSSRLTKLALWAGLAVVLAAITIRWWAPFFN